MKKGSISNNQMGERVKMRKYHFMATELHINSH